jgi:hypothetical protein
VELQKDEESLEASREKRQAPTKRDTPADDENCEKIPLLPNLNLVFKLRIIYPLKLSFKDTKDYKIRVFTTNGPSPKEIRISVRKIPFIFLKITLSVKLR